MIKKISKSKISKLKKTTLEHFPTYTTYIINRASETAQATRPKVVGQMTEIFKDYLEFCESNSIEESIDSWENYYLKRNPYAIQNASEKAWSMILNFKSAFELIDFNLVEEWITDLLIKKTFYGLHTESLIKLYFKDLGFEVRRSNPSEESQNIDLFIDNRPYQIKPLSYKNEKMIRDRIHVPILFFKVEDGGILLDIQDEYLSQKI